MVDNLSDIITCAKFQDELFKSYDFTGDQISHFLLIFAWALQQSSAIVLFMIQHLLTFVLTHTMYFNLIICKLECSLCKKPIEK